MFSIKAKRLTGKTKMTLNSALMGVDLEEKNEGKMLRLTSVKARSGHVRTLDIFLQMTGICWKPGEGL